MGVWIFLVVPFDSTAREVGKKQSTLTNERDVKEITGVKRIILT